jgi:arylsulfatase A-like enzyme
MATVGSTRRGFLAGLASAATCAALPRPVKAGEPPGGNADRPNVVVIMADDLGWADVGCYGAKGVRTPNMDRIAREGVRFTEAHSESACCTPTRYGLLTGRYSWRGRLKSGVLGWNSPLLIEDGRMTAAALMKSAGYATACVGKWHLGIGENGPDWDGELKPGPLEVGFDSYFGVLGDNHTLPILAQDRRLVDPEDAKRVRHYGDKALQKARQHEIGPRLSQKAVEFIERSRDRPFFLLYTPCSIHWPISPAPPFQGTSEAGPRGDFIHELDWSVGEVLAALDRLKLADRTLLIFTSDNGGQQPGSMGPFRALKTSVYEGGHRVPLVARWPGRTTPGRVCDETICLNGVLATCAAILGKALADDAGEDSFSFLPALTGQKHEGPVQPVMINKACRGPAIAIREGPWKLIMPKGFWPTKEGVAALKEGRLGKGELYNLAEDVGETSDLYDRRPEIVERLSDRMARCIVEGRSRPS